MRSPVWSAAFAGIRGLCQAWLRDLLELATLCAGMAFDGHDDANA
jgi:hypothetical protein